MTHTMLGEISPAVVVLGARTSAPWYLSGERGFVEPVLGGSICAVNARATGFNGPQRATGNYRPLVALAQSPPTESHG